MQPNTVAIPLPGPGRGRRAATSRRNPAWSRFGAAIAVLVLVGLDQLSKSTAPRWRTGRVVMHRNDELAFGLHAGWMGTTVAVPAAVVAACWLAGVAGACLRRRAGGPVLALFVAGALSNGLDRIILGHVRDWFVVGRTAWNLADLFLLVAIPAGVLIAWLHVRNGERR